LNGYNSSVDFIISHELTCICFQRIIGRFVAERAILLVEDLEHSFQLFVIVGNSLDGLVEYRFPEFRGLQLAVVHLFESEA
jgi:hypothetical protein